MCVRRKRTSVKSVKFCQLTQKYVHPKLPEKNRKFFSIPLGRLSIAWDGTIITF
jgi:hypothetical protein